MRGFVIWVLVLVAVGYLMAAVARHTDAFKPIVVTIPAVRSE